MIDTRIVKCRVLGISVLCTALFLLSGISVSEADNTSIDCNKEIAKIMVHGTAAGLGEVLKDIKAEGKRIDVIRAFITPIRYFPDDSGYFYVYDFKYRNIAHATQKHLQGKNVYDYKNSKGKYPIRDVRDAAKKGGGFVEYFWVKPGSKDEFKKLGYVEPIPGTNYVIGSGLYLL